jgi:hypothetical protein
MSQADGLAAHNHLRWLRDGEGVRVMPPALAKFVGKAMPSKALIDCRRAFLLRIAEVLEW